MAYFEDLSVCTYDNSFYRPDTRNVGWLAKGHDFPKTDSGRGNSGLGLDLVWGAITEYQLRT